jgi:hypothetical protein
MTYMDVYMYNGSVCMIISYPCHMVLQVGVHWILEFICGYLLLFSAAQVNQDVFCILVVILGGTT